MADLVMHNLRAFSEQGRVLSRTDLPMP